MLVARRSILSDADVNLDLRLFTWSLRHILILRSILYPFSLSILWIRPMMYQARVTCVSLFINLRHPRDFTSHTSRRATMYTCIYLFFYSSTGNSHIPHENRGVSRNSPYQYVAFMRISACCTLVSSYSTDKCWQTLIVGTYMRVRMTSRHGIILSRRSMVNLPIHQVPRSTAWKALFCMGPQEKNASWPKVGA